MVVRSVGMGSWWARVGRNGVQGSETVANLNRLRREVRGTTRRYPLGSPTSETIPVHYLKVGLAVAAVLLMGLAHAAPCEAGTCTQEHVAVDTLGYDAAYLMAPELGGVGEVVYCADTVVTSVTFWLIPPSFDAGYNCVLFVSKGPTPPDSVFANVPIYRGPTRNGAYPAGTLPFPVTFTLDPPCLLPSPGMYFFGLWSCQGPSIFVMSHIEDVFPQGRAWGVGRGYCDIDYPQPGSIEYPTQPTADLAFDIEFCKSTTPVHESSWGAIKTRYR